MPKITYFTGKQFFRKQFRCGQKPRSESVWYSFLISHRNEKRRKLARRQLQQLRPLLPPLDPETPKSTSKKGRRPFQQPLRFQGTHPRSEEPQVDDAAGQKQLFQHQPVQRGRQGGTERSLGPGASERPEGGQERVRVQRSSAEEPTSGAGRFLGPAEHVEGKGGNVRYCSAEGGISWLQKNFRTVPWVAKFWIFNQVYNNFIKMV